MSDPYYKIVRSPRLSKAERVFLARAVLERARQALHDSQESATGAVPPGKPRIWGGVRYRLSRHMPAALTVFRPRFGAIMARAIGRQFECVAIAGSLMIAGTAWLVHGSF